MEKNREKILNATEKLLNDTGRDALTVRAVAEAANVQAPAIYRLFTDKKALLDAVAERGFKRYMSIPNDAESLGPIEELRRGWDIHVDFGVDNPELYKLMFGELESSQLTPGAKVAYEGMDRLMSHLAGTGSFKVSQEEATFAAFSSASGVVLTLLSLPASSQSSTYRINTRERLVQDIMVGPTDIMDNTVTSLATTLIANMDSIDNLSPNEKSLLSEWLKRIK